MTEAFDCSLLELDLIGDALGLDVRQFPFDFPVHGDSLDDRRRFVDIVRNTLTAKGLFRSGAFAPELEQAVGVFARGRLGIAVLGMSGQRQLCLRAAIDGAVGVLAEQHGGIVRFTRVSPHAIVNQVVSLLPPLRPGPGSSVTITAPAEPTTRTPRHQREDDDLGAATYLQPVRPAPGTDGAARAAAESILRRPRLGGGYFTVTVRGRDGREPSPATLSWVDTDAGRYAVVPTTGNDGLTRVTYSPADAPRLAQLLSGLVAAA